MSRKSEASEEAVVMPKWLTTVSITQQDTQPRALNGQKYLTPLSFSVVSVPPSFWRAVIMKTWDEPKKRKAHIELIPMIDVMMFLLVFFVLVSLNVIPALGMKTQLPSASSAQQLKPQNKAILTLGTNGELQLDGQDIQVDALVAALKAQEKPDSKTTIIVNSDKGVEVARLVEVMDTLRLGGFTSVSIATRKS
jgi:biopolymer transport protein ExbD